MGCALSTRPSMNSPPQGLHKLKMENGYAKADYPRKSTGQRPFRYENEKGNNHVGMDEGKKKKSISSNGDDVIERVDLMHKTTIEDDLVDGWPKWLIDTIPNKVMKNILLKSADSYVKIDKVGHGTYSNVYKARDKHSGKIVALKKVRFDTSEPESVKFMAREIMILHKLDHPNIVKLQGLATSRMQYSLYLVFDYYHSDLSRIISQPDQSLSEPQIKCYMHQLLSGLQHCHEMGILHRDIKGSNLLIDSNGTLKVADFGLASPFNPEKKRPLTNRVVTLWYRAPELLLGSTDYGIGIDLWSAGCLMVEMFQGRPIMPGRTEVEQLHRIFKLCGTPPDDYYKRLKLSTALKPPKPYKSTLHEAFKNIPLSSFSLLNTLLNLEPKHRGTAALALQNEFFSTSPLACDLSGLPIIHIEDDGDDQDFMIDKRNHRTSKARRRSRSQREQSRKGLSKVEKTKEDAKGPNEELQLNADIPVFSLEPGTSTTNTSSTIAKPPIVLNDEMSPRTEAHDNANKNVKNRPPVANVKRYTDNYKMNTGGDSRDRLDLVQRSTSTREFRSLENKNRLKLLSMDD